MKKIFSLLLCVISLTMFMPLASEASSVTPVKVSSQSDISPMAEEAEWFFRYTEDGTLQKRLWSITYQKWLTDWIDV